MMWGLCKNQNDSATTSRFSEPQVGQVNASDKKPHVSITFTSVECKTAAWPAKLHRL
jgi:hypothetical protein